MNCEIKYIVSMKDNKGKGLIARVKAANVKEAKHIASEHWPKYTILNVNTRTQL